MFPPSTVRLTAEAPKNSTPSVRAPLTATTALTHYGGVDPKADIDGESAETLAAAVAVNTQRYIPACLPQKIRQRERQKSWNWAAFFLSDPIGSSTANASARGTIAATIGLICNLMVSF